jgi:sulfite reductase (ferredoxin)
VERLALRYLDGRSEGETFANWVVRADEELLK